VESVKRKVEKERRNTRKPITQIVLDQRAKQYDDLFRDMLPESFDDDLK